MRIYETPMKFCSAGGVCIKYSAQKFEERGGATVAAHIINVYH